ncbi:MAG TPA: hypothetical protein VIR55_06785 [Ignavibacteria bacterium]
MEKKKKSFPKNKKKSIFTPSAVNKIFYLSIVVLFALFFIVLVKTAWLSDDSFITLRVIDNFVNGYGLRYNVVERVQAYTHPLWLFLLTLPYFVFKDPFYTPILISIALTLLLLYLLIFKLSISRFNSIFIIILLIASKSFIDYSSSGLENPLSHLLIVIYIYFYLKEIEIQRKILILSFIISLSYLNRIDSILIYIPSLFYLFYQNHSKKSFLYAIYGFLPIILWTVFSIVYYGFPFPNTFYAKINTGIPKLEIFSQGVYYFINSLKFDTITLVIIFLVIGITFIKRIKIHYYIVFGILLYLIYIIYIGGDFMSGRFFSLPFITAIAILVSSITFNGYYVKLFLSIIFVLYLILYPYTPVKTGIDYADKTFNFLDENGISDERGYYYQNTSLWKAINGYKIPQHQMIDVAQRQIEMKEKVFLAGAIGFLGYYAGPSLYVIDVYALSDAFLSKLPVVKYDLIYGRAYEKKFNRKPNKNWRIGHFLRPLPEGFTLSKIKNDCLIKDSLLNEFYKKIYIITQSSIFSFERFNEIIKMNLGLYDKLKSHYKEQEYVETNYYDDLIAANPNSMKYYFGKGNWYFRRQIYDKALPYFIKTIQMDSTFSLAWYRLSISYFYYKDFSNAFISLQKAKKYGEKVDSIYEKALYEKYYLQTLNK